MACKNELNSQIKGLQSRLDRAEKDINAHFVGISQLVLSLAANPFTAGSAAASVAIYNLQPMGMKILRALLDALIPKEIQNTIRMITLLEAATFDDLVEGVVDAAEAQVVSAVNQGIDMVTNTALGAMTAINNELNSLVPNLTDGLLNSLGQLSVSNSRSEKVDLAQLAYNAWYDASIAPINQVTQTALNGLRVAYLQAQQIVNTIDAGAVGVIAQANGMLSGIAPTIDEVNAALHQFNSLAAFILTQSDIANCKCVAVKIGNSV